METTTLYVTHKNQEEADKVVNALLEKKLIACANFSQVNSVYRWEGKIEHQPEVVSFIKTRKENFEIVRDEILKIHSYETPCILKLDAEVNDSYGNWILTETNNG
jgi:periplasmic divalent cation tolerance protein